MFAVPPYNSDSSCNDHAYVAWSLGTPALSNSHTGTLSLWFKWDITAALPAYVPLLFIKGGMSTSYFSIMLGNPPFLNVPIKCSLVMQMLTSSGRVASVLLAGAVNLQDGRWHHIMVLQDSTGQGPGLLLLDGRYHALQHFVLSGSGTSSSSSSSGSVPPTWWNAMNGTVKLGHGSGVGEVTVGGYDKSAIGVRSFVGGFQFWKLSLYGSTLGACQAVMLHLQDAAMLAFTVDPSHATGYVYDAIWAGQQTDGSMVLMHAAITSSSTGAGNMYVMSALSTRLDPPASSFSARSCVAGVNAKLARTSPINPMQCTAWSPAGFDVLCSTAPMDTSVNLTTYFDQRQQIKQQVTASFASQRKIVAIAVATTMAVAATASMGLSAMVSAAAAQAAAALTTMGVEVGLGAALSGVGVDNMVRHLQLFALSGSLSSNLSTTYLNLASALEWLNFQVDLGVPGATSGSHRTVNAAASLETSNIAVTGRRRLMSLSGAIAEMRQLRQGATDEANQIANLVWAESSTRLAAVAMLFALVLLVHWLLLLAWPRVGFLKRRHLPALLVFPRLELMVWNASLVGVTQAFVMLLSSKCTLQLTSL
eukprot:jgi/Chrzof1/8352/Cz03g07080.t1